MSERLRPSAIADKDVKSQASSLRELQAFATLESPRLGEMRLATWRKSCRLFDLDPAIADGLADFSVLKRVYGQD